MTNDKSSLERQDSDATKIVRKHMEDEHHVISEEEMRNIRVGSTPPPTGSEAEKLNQFDEEMEEAHKDDEDAAGANNHPTTPWDTVNP